MDNINWNTVKKFVEKGDFLTADKDIQAIYREAYILRTNGVTLNKYIQVYLQFIGMTITHIKQKDRKLSLDGIEVVKKNLANIERLTTNMFKEEKAEG
jgi:hypothetical protein